jgi:DNA helicase-2/ATP-dependent DNA helicase PcrA
VSAVVEEVARECFELEVVDDLSLGEGVLGELDLEAETIGVRPGLEPGRRAFTVAHELGHAAMGHPARLVRAGYERRISDPEGNVDERVGRDELEAQNGVYQAYSARDLMEIEANMFAAELLIPTEVLLAAIAESPGWTADEFARQFGVSDTAMLTQLSNVLLLRRGNAQAEFEDALPAALEEDAGGEGSAPGLDAEQRKAIVADTPALVIAGPGAGKTRVLAERYAHLVRSGVSADSILAVTFTNKAAEEMRQRVTGMLDLEQAGDVKVSTFHAFCLEVLKGYGRWISLAEGFTLATEMDASLIVRRKLCDLELSHLENLSDPSLHVPAVLDAISRAKDELREPEEFVALAQAWVEAAEDEEEKEAAGKALETGKVYAAYQGWLAADQRVDYGDLIRLTLQILELPGVGDEIKSRYSHVLVDEFQDINFANGRLLRAMDDGRGIVWAVADPDQSIYRFRGASSANLDRFGDDYPDFQLIRLDSNYRSGPDIVGACHGLRSVLATAGEKDDPAPLKAVRPASEEPAVSLAVVPDREAELDYLVEQIRERSARGVPLGDQAVLCTSNAQARRVSDRLMATGLATRGPTSLLGGEEIKDALALLALLRGDQAARNGALLRVAGFDDNPLTVAEALMLLDWSRDEGLSMMEAIGRCGEVEKLSAPSTEFLMGLHELLNALPTWGDAWHAVLAYAFHPRARLRGLFSNPSDAASVRLSQVGQLAVLARSFSDREDLVEGEGIGGFIEYVREAAASKKGEGVLYAPPTENAVQVMTVHKSKGLEFPVVYVPYLAKGHFPVRGGGAEVRLPPGLTHDDETENKDEDDRCLFYVALTRAENELILSRAETYGKAAKALPLIDRLVAEKDGRTMIAKVVWEPGAEPTTGSALTAPPVVSTVVRQEDEARHFWELESYDRCPLQAGYSVISRLPNRRHAYQDFRDCVYRTLGDMQVLARETGEYPTREWTKRRLAEVWKEEGPVGHFYEPAYRRRAEQIVEMWQASRGPLRWDVREGLSLTTAGGTRLEVKADAISRGPDGEIVIARHRFGHARKSHKEGRNADRHALYVAAARQTWPGYPVEVVVHYLPRDERLDATPTERVISGRLKKLTGYAESIEEGNFPAKPGRECMKCPWNLICPSSA